MSDPSLSNNQAQLLGAVLDSALDGIMSFRSVRDASGRIVDFRIELVNKQSEQIVGRKAEELIGSLLLTEFPGNKEDGLFDAYVKVAETGEPFVTEHRYAHEGMDIWFRISAGQCGDGFTVTFADITQSKNIDERFRVLFECSTDAHLLYDPSGVIDCNEAAVAMLGYDKKQELLRVHPATLSPEVQPCGLTSQAKKIKLEAELKEKGFVRFDWIHLRKDGSEIPVEVTLNPVTVAGRSVTLAVWHDLTARVETEQRIKTANERFELLVAGNASGIWDWDCRTDALYWSPRFKELIGYTDAEIEPAYHDFEARLHPEDKQATLERLQQHMAQQGPYDVEYRLRHKDGHYVWCHAAGQAQWDESGQPIRMAGSLSDISTRKSAQAALIDQRHRLEFALDASSTGLWDWSVRDQTVLYSDTWYTMLGYKPGELPMTFATWESLVHPEDLPRAKETIQLYLDGDSKHYACELRMRNQQGDWQWVKTIGEAAERDTEGRVSRIVGLHLDIHAQKVAQENLASARDIAQQASASKSAFVANMSHEIRTPMNAILGYADLLLDADQTEADKRNHAQTIRRNGKHLLNILNDVLDISKIEAGKMSIEQVPCVPDQLFADVITLMMPKAIEKGLDLDLQAVDPLPQRVMTDPTRLRQVLLNLIGNAIKFTEQGSVRVEVHNKRLDDDRIEMRCDVVDTGIGIAAENLDRLFKPFQQADESTTRKFGGTGLGLAISHNLCGMLGGELSCTSTHGEGSTFSARFIVGTANEKQAKQSTARSSSINHGDLLVDKRVLVVEDGPDNQRLIKHYLAKVGCQVELAENGQVGRDAALKAADDNKAFDVILMDMQMPVLDGYSATAQLREAGYALPIIALTAHASANDRAACLEAGCTDYLSKPVDRHKLIRLIAGYVDASIQQGAGI